MRALGALALLVGCGATEPERTEPTWLIMCGNVTVKLEKEEVSGA